MYEYKNTSICPFTERTNQLGSWYTHLVAILRINCQVQVLLTKLHLTEHDAKVYTLVHPSLSRLARCCSTIFRHWLEIPIYWNQREAPEPPRPHPPSLPLDTDWYIKVEVPPIGGPLVTEGWGNDYGRSTSTEAGEVRLWA